MSRGTKLSVEKALEKIRRSDQSAVKPVQKKEEEAKLDEEIARIRAQRARLAPHRTKPN